MGFLYLSFQIEELSLLHISGHLSRKKLGMPAKLSTTFNPQNDRQEERTIQTLEDMLRACMIDFKGS